MQTEGSKEKQFNRYEGQRNSDFSRKCQVCGKGHMGICKYKNYKCNVIGHLAAMCKQTKSSNFLLSETVLEESENLIYNLSGNNIKPFSLNVKVNDVMLSAQVDTGSGLTVISEKTFKELFMKNIKLQKSNIKVNGYTGEKIEVLGYISTNISFNEKKCKNFKVHVIKHGGPNLLGRDFMNAFEVSLTNINMLKTELISTDIEKLKVKYAKLFNDNIGKYVHETFKIRLKEQAVPIFHKPRPIPFAFREKVEIQLKKLEKQGIITPIESNEWGSPLVPILKTDGSVRICADYKVTVNKYVEDVKYPLPRVEEVFHKISKGKEFSKIDLREAYNQLEIDDESSKILAWSTHKGLFKINRLPYGISPASAIFQRVIEQLFEGKNDVTNFLDDIIVTGENKEKHLKNLEMVFDILYKAGLRVKLSKCEFFKKVLCYLGHKISAEGLSKCDDKIKAIVEAPAPTNITQVKSFAGLVNYYSKFVPNISIIMRPIYDLLTKGKVFVWSQKCQDSFDKIKQLIVSDKILIHFN